MNFMFPVPLASLDAREICSEISHAGISLLCFCHIIVFYHNNFQVRTYFRIIVDDLLQTEDQMNDILGDHISRSRLCAEDCRNRSRRNFSGFDLQIFVNNIKRIQLLPLILMETFYLDIKNRIRADLNLLCIFQICAQCFFVFVFDLQKLFKNVFVIFVLQQFFQFGSILLVALSDGLIQEFCQKRITVKKPAPECNTVCLVIELLRINLIKIIQLRVLSGSLCAELPHRLR